MCRNIRVLHNFKPPTTRDEIHAAALQYIRKVSGIREPGSEAERAFEKAVEQVAQVTSKLLAGLPKNGEPRTREGEKLKAKARWERRERQIRSA